MGIRGGGVMGRREMEGSITQERIARVLKDLGLREFENNICKSKVLRNGERVTHWMADDDVYPASLGDALEDAGIPFEQERTVEDFEGRGWSLDLHTPDPDRHYFAFSYWKLTILARKGHRIKDGQRARIIPLRKEGGQ